MVHMKNPEDVFHLAIPCAELGSTEVFYKALGCDIARKYDDRITLNFFGGQIVCHLSEKIDSIVEMYPRHFGVTFKSLTDFDQLYQRAKDNNIKFFKDLFIRFPGKREEHRTFFLVDPSNNLLEFKYYNDSEMMY